MRRNVSYPEIIPVVLAGGEGMRLAPLSTPARPKPFVPLPDGRSLLTHTLARVQGEGWAAPLLIGQARHRYALLNHARDAGVRPAAILLEPQPKNTAMAMAAVAHFMRQRQPQAVLAFLPADHWIAPIASWQESMHHAAVQAKQEGTLCLLGMQPTTPNPQLGYILPADTLQGAPVRAVRRFIEKPTDAAAYWQTAYWNAGQCVVTAERLAALFIQHAPHVWAATQAAVDGALQRWEFFDLEAAAYAALSVAPPSFDHAVLEPAATQCAVAPCITGWEDLGTLESWARVIGPISAHSTAPPRVDRPWGYYELLQEAPGYIEKRLTLYPGCRISLQRHWHRNERWEVLSGIAEVELEGQFHTLNKCNIIHIDAGMWHRLRNVGQELLIIHEIQHGNPYEEDIERQKDDYGRENIKLLQ